MAIAEPDPAEDRLGDADVGDRPRVRQERHGLGLRAGRAERGKAEAQERGKGEKTAPRRQG
jgi:hypothetical protein